MSFNNSKKGAEGGMFFRRLLNVWNSLKVHIGQRKKGSHLRNGCLVYAKV